MPAQSSPIPGSYKYRSDLRDPGKRFVPAPTQWQAIWNTFLRNYTPWGPLTVDPSPTGTGGKLGKVASAVPYAGGGIEALLAGRAAGQQAGQMVEVPEAPSPTSNILKSLGNTLGFVPGGGTGMQVAKAGVGAAGGAVDFFSSDYFKQLQTAMRGPDQDQASRVAQLWDDDERERGQPTRGQARSAGAPTVAGIPTSFNEPTPTGDPTQTDPGPAPAPTTAPAPDLWYSYSFGPGYSVNTANYPAGTDPLPYIPGWGPLVGPVQSP